ncbi:hypothetical protein FH5_03531 [Priestia endophytica]|nr:hypothetical protein FH5_03531 [Priestia endophytica]
MFYIKSITREVNYFYEEIVDENDNHFGFVHSPIKWNDDR